MDSSPERGREASPFLGGSCTKLETVHVSCFDKSSSILSTYKLLAE